MEGKGRGKESGGQGSRFGRKMERKRVNWRASLEGLGWEEGRGRKLMSKEKQVWKENGEKKDEGEQVWRDWDRNKGGEES